MSAAGCFSFSSPCDFHILFYSLSVSGTSLCPYVVIFFLSETVHGGHTATAASLKKVGLRF